MKVEFEKDEVISTIAACTRAMNHWFKEGETAKKQRDMKRLLIARRALRNLGNVKIKLRNAWASEYQTEMPDEEKFT